MIEPVWEKYVQKPIVVKAFLATEKLQVQTISGIVVVDAGEYLVDFGDGNYKKYEKTFFGNKFTRFEQKESELLEG